ncbi:MAG: hypothetical protein IPL40_04445 [Proteobacteria bacterium]|nr:hypothetical protein [Pseudomonadota bacterium]
MTERQEAPAASASPGVEADALPVVQVGLWVLALLGLVVIVVLALWQYFDAVSQRELVAQDLSQVPPALPELRARDRRLLNHYEVVDAPRGLFRIPVARAMELLAADPALIAPLELASPSPAPLAPSPTPAPPAAARVILPAAAR